MFVGRRVMVGLALVVGSVGAGCDGPAMDADGSVRDGAVVPDSAVLRDGGVGTDSSIVRDGGADGARPLDGAVTLDAEAIDAATLDAARLGDGGGCTPIAVCPALACGTIDDGCGGELVCADCADGAACDDDEDCAGGICNSEAEFGAPGGFCTESCRTDFDCAVTSHCARVDPITLVGNCRVDCLTSADCRTGYQCLDRDGPPFSRPDPDTECTVVGSGAGVVGDACDSAADCAGGVGGRCIPEALGFRNGYCSMECSPTVACPSGSHCGFADADGNGSCIRNCGADSACRGGSDGYLCFDGDSGGGDECLPAGTGSTAVGGACAGAWDCAGGQNARCLNSFLGGYCVTIGCATDVDCGAGAHCGTHVFDDDTSLNVCAADCTVGTTVCRPGQLCWDNNEDGQDECWSAGTGTVPVGGACSFRYECSGGTRGFCVVETETGNFADGMCAIGGCTIGGTGSESCPSGSHCEVYAPGPRGNCLPNCTGPGDCRADGYDCFDDEDMGSTLSCLPSATGTGAIGDPCLVRSDCGGGRYGFCLVSENFRGGYCTSICTAGCPGGSTCITPVNPPDGICLDGCAMSSDCREPEYACLNADGIGGVESCYPP